MILQDAHRILALGKDIKAMDQKIAAIAAHSELAQTIGSLPGFGKTSMAEIAGEVGSLARFKSEAGLAVYRDMSTLDNSSGKKSSAKTPCHVNTRAKAAMMVAVGTAYRLRADRAPTTTRSVRKASSTIRQFEPWAVISCESFGQWLNWGENTKYDKT